MLMKSMCLRCRNNLPAPTGERATRNESSPGALGIPELMPPNGGEASIVNLPAPTGERATRNESTQAHWAYRNLCRLMAAGLSKERYKKSLSSRLNLWFDRVFDCKCSGSRLSPQMPARSLSKRTRKKRIRGPVATASSIVPIPMIFH